MNSTNPAVYFYFSKNKQWLEELEKLRTFVLDCGLSEELKWGVPCYTLQQKNVCLLHVFKEYCALLFVKGALLKDAQGLLVQQTENTQAARQLRFTNVREIVEREVVVKAYVQEAIAIEKSGLKVGFKANTEFAVPAEFRQKLAEMPALKTAFAALTPGRQRAYLICFSAAKQAKTREARVDKWLPQILSGKGLDD
ncbi:YdeI/OmpD-associated family protein [Hymenobacter sp. BT683]|uniref:YdeI/OmpD-associated family protein n=1 Tax=Hymenobacter jeongseonensis TaxID=2791027 RepID=A0ABS0ID78_9BACT|nr:DUF1801 domain-containing protein [Hymenobacter jeongseonensis]MBF9236306.1 YdeI/OmpD-associated family protein [Hymenobacter jeongseonensis]